MKFDYSQFEQFIGKEIIVYSLDYDHYFEATIIDYEFIKYSDKHPTIFFKIDITNDYGIHYFSKVVTESEFKKTWGFKGTKFGNYLINLYLHNIEKHKKTEEKKN